MSRSAAGYTQTVISMAGLWAWLRCRPVTALLTPLVLWVVWQFLDWALIRAVFLPNLDACGAVDAGACWGVIVEKAPVILFGRYPIDQWWRAALFVLVWTGVLFWLARATRVDKQGFAAYWVMGLAVLSLCLLAGGVLGLPAVDSKWWGGLVLTLLLSMLGFGLALPLGVLLALGRRSRHAWLRQVCGVYIETCRALPLVAVLFLAAYVVPLYVPGAAEDLLPRVIITLALFASAYLAEVIRGGLQVVPDGQVMAAQALGLGYWQTQALIVLPQALRACLPSLTNSFVTLFKECSLVSIVSLFELTGALTLALSGDVQWRQFYLEGYIFVAALYWVYCYGVVLALRERR